MDTLDAKRRVPLKIISCQMERVMGVGASRRPHLPYSDDAETNGRGTLACLASARHPSASLNVKATGPVGQPPLPRNVGAPVRRVDVDRPSAASQLLKRLPSRQPRNAERDACSAFNSQPHCLVRERVMGVEPTTFTLAT